MLALKKKREAEKKAAAAAAAAAEAEGKTVEEPKGTEKVSLLGIGGKKKTKSGESTGTKKRTPGELRIQKGVCVFVSCGIFVYCSRAILIFLRPAALFVRFCEKKKRHDAERVMSCNVVVAFAVGVILMCMRNTASASLLSLGLLSVAVAVVGVTQLI